MRVALHAINGVGLGHLVRIVTLAEEIRALVPRCRLLVLTNAADITLLERAGIDYVKTPPRLEDPHADPARITKALPEPVEMAALSSALSVFRPDLMVFDTHAPEPLVRHVAGLGARSVLVLRELRQEVLAAFLGSPRALAFDRIVVPHEPGEVELGGSEGFLPIVVTGPVVRRLEVSPEGRAASPPRVVVMAGGGGQPVSTRRFLRAAADAHLLARARIPDLETTLVTGPYGEAPKNLEGLAGLTVLGADPELPQRIARATIVVSQAGYNAVAEIRALARPAILVPGYRKSEDQAARARRLVQSGAAVMARADARSIADHLEHLLLSPSALKAMVRAHEENPLVPKNRATAEAILAPIRRSPCLERVVLVAHDFPPKIGGMETVALGLARGLVARGIDVRVYTTKRFGPPPAGLPPEAVRALFTPAPGGQLIDVERDLLITLDALLRDQPSVVHLCNAGLAPWAPALRAALPAAVTVHVHGNDLLLPWVHHGSSPEAYRAAQIGGLSEADAVFAVSSYSASLARAQGAEGARILTIENGVDAARFEPGPVDSALRERLGIAPEDEVVLTVSRLVPRKGHRVVLEAMASVLRERPRALFVFTGESPRLLAELLALAETLRIRSRIRPLGFVAEGELPALYRLAKVFVLLPEGDGGRDVEGFGVALIEASASGLPVVATKSGGVPEAVLDGVTGVLVPEGDAASAGTAIAALLADPERAKALGESGRKRCLDRLSTSGMTDRMVTQFAAVLRTKKRSPARTLGSFVRAFEGEALPPEGAPRSLHQALAGATSGVALVRIAQAEVAHERASSARRRELFESILARGRTVRLRATDGGGRLLPEALEMLAALGHRPDVDLKLRRFVEPDFQAHALPLLRSVYLVHSVPMETGRTLVERLRSLPREALAKVRGMRIFATHEAQPKPELLIAAVPEVHAIRRLFAEHGVSVLPPPELMRYLSETPAGGPETGMIEPTNLCNLACPTCPTGNGKIAPRPAMTLAQFDEVIRALVPRLRTLALWNYGEPLLNRELPAMIAHAKAAKVHVVKVATNAHFLDPERAQALIDAGLDVLIVSVDGATEGTYTTFRKSGDFGRVTRNITSLAEVRRKLGKKTPRIELQFIVMRHNEHEISLVRTLATSLGVDRLRIKTVGIDGEERRGLVPTARLLSRYEADATTPNVRHPFCTMAWDHTVVNVDGSVTPCCYLRPDMGEAFVMGNLFETPFPAIWRGPKYRAFRAAMLTDRSRMPVCGRCRGSTRDLDAAIEEVGTS